MKLLLTVLLSSSCLIGFAQNPTDSLSAFIARHYYVRLTDTPHLAKGIIPYLPLITEHLSATNYGEPSDIYIDAANVWESSKTINIPIVNINGIKTLKREEDRADSEKLKDSVTNKLLHEHIFIGDPAGKHNLIINKADRTLKYYMEQ